MLGPGSLYTSVLPVLLIPAIRDAVAAAPGMRIYACNVAMQPGETEGYDLADHVEALVAHTQPDLVDLVLANDRFGGGGTGRRRDLAARRGPPALAARARSRAAPRDRRRGQRRRPASPRPGAARGRDPAGVRARGPGDAPRSRRAIRLTVRRDGRHRTRPRPRAARRARGHRPVAGVRPRGGAGGPRTGGPSARSVARAARRPARAPRGSPGAPRRSTGRPGRSTAAWPGCAVGSCRRAR